MKQTIKIGIVGDFNPNSPSHKATNEALFHASEHCGLAVDVQWIPTIALDDQPAQTLDAFAALWCAPGSPYQSMEGALNGIRYAREENRPFIGT